MLPEKSVSKLSQQENGSIYLQDGAMEEPSNSFLAMREGRVFDESSEYNDQRITPLAIRGAPDKGF